MEKLRKLQEQLRDNQLKNEVQIEILNRENRQLHNENQQLRETLKNNSIVQENIKLKKKIEFMRNKAKKLNKMLDEQEEKKMDNF